MFDSKKKSYIFCAVLLVVLVLFDQITKYLATVFLKDAAEDVPVLGDAFVFRYLGNDGAAWSMLRGQRVLFIILTAVFIVVIGYFIFRIPKKRHYAPLFITLTVLLAGAVGNFIDRLFNGFVVDFLYFKLINFPIFNVADCYVTISVIVLVVLILFKYKGTDLSFGKKDEADVSSASNDKIIAEDTSEGTSASSSDTENS